MAAAAPASARTTTNMVGKICLKSAIISRTDICTLHSWNQVTKTALLGELTRASISTEAISHSCRIDAQTTWLIKSRTRPIDLTCQAATHSLGGVIDATSWAR